MSEHQKLREQVDAHDAAYERGEPMIPDHKYDELAKRLEQVEMRLGVEPKLRKCGLAGRKVQHDQPFLGLQSTYDPQELEDWMRGIQIQFQGCEFLLAWKHDGVAVRCVAECVNGVNTIKLATTRGDGRVGTDVTQYIRFDRITELHGVVTNGEAVIRRSNLESINEVRRASGLPAFKSCRSAVVSALNGHCDEVVDYIKVQSHFSSYAMARTSDIQAIFGCIQQVTQTQPDEYECDGFVIYVQDWEIRKQLGQTGCHPRWAMAYKNDYYALESVVTGIVDQRGQKRRIQFEPRSAGFRTYSTAVCHEWITPVVGAKCAIHVRGGNPILAAVF